VGGLRLQAQHYVIVNLQETPKDDDAAMIIKATVDTVVDRLMRDLGYISWKDKLQPVIERRWTPPPKPASCERSQSRDRQWSV
jgi:hypothetical protein